MGLLSSPVLLSQILIIGTFTISALDLSLSSSLPFLFALASAYLQKGQYQKAFSTFLFLKWAIPGLFFIYFRSFQINNSIFTTNECEKMSCQSSIPRQDSNPRPLECESPPITTRPGLPPKISIFLFLSSSLTASHDLLGFLSLPFDVRSS